jgi:selenocysteine lyase/cysteine desulfurase
VIRPEDLYRSPNALAKHYADFRVGDRLLLTGHSHQAWPDCAREGLLRCWEDAAEQVDRKWDRAFERADRVRDGWSRLLGGPDGEIALGPNTHELGVRFLSSLALRERPRIVTTDGEFHSLRRQLARLEEEGLEIVRLPAEPVETLAGRLARETDERTAAVAVSCVMFRSARIVPHLGDLFDACAAVGTELLIDAYHALNVVPFPLPELGLEQAFVVGGGYKYCQLGEGNCFLYVPAGCSRRPVVTGWFAEFADLSDAAPGTVAYGAGAARFAGATYDPVSHYRAAEVFAFFDRQGLSPELLRAVSQHQVGVLTDAFDALGIDPAVVRRDRSHPLSTLGGFLCLRTPHAAALNAGLFERGVYTDFRGEVLRFGPAPYLSDEQLRDAMTALRETVRSL